MARLPQRAAEPWEARAVMAAGETARPKPVDPRLGASPPEVSRHLAVPRRAGLLTARRQGRYIRHTLNLPHLTAPATDLPAAVLR